jgi:histidine triad (HIT) family protein
MHMSTYDPDNVFAKILRGEIPSEPVYEDAEFIVVRDIAPIAPTHLLVIPRAARSGPAALTDEDTFWLGRMVLVATKVATDHGLADGGYRLVLNEGREGGKAVPHLHMHIVGGRELGPIG